MQSSAQTVDEYLAELPEERREAIQVVRKVILDNLPAGYEEGIQYGLISYFVPHSLFPAGYHCNPAEPLTYIGLGSQKNYMSLYLMCVYGNTEMNEWFTSEYRARNMKLDMGKSCVRFKKVSDLPLDVIAQAVSKVSLEAYVARYVSIRDEMKSRKKS